MNITLMSARGGLFRRCTSHQVIEDVEISLSGGQLEVAKVEIAVRSHLTEQPLDGVECTRAMRDALRA